MIIVSVIIPTYNGEKTIERAIKSVLNQTAKCNFEILICDDRSNDKTIEIAEKYNCIIFKNDINTGGPNNGRNKGILFATGNFIAFLDQDDEWLPNKIKDQLKETQYNDFIYSRRLKKTEQGG